MDKLGIIRLAGIDLTEERRRERVAERRWRAWLKVIGLMGWLTMIVAAGMIVRWR